MPKERDTKQGCEREILRDICKYAKNVCIYTQIHKL